MSPTSLKFFGRARSFCDLVFLWINQIGTARILVPNVSALRTFRVLRPIRSLTQASHATHDAHTSRLNNMSAITHHQLNLSSGPRAKKNRWDYATISSWACKCCYCIVLHLCSVRNRRHAVVQRTTTFQVKCAYAREFWVHIHPWPVRRLMPWT